MPGASNSLECDNAGLTPKGATQLQHIRPAVVLLVLMSALTGLIYPLAVTRVAQIALRHQADGSLITKDGVVVGSALIGPTFQATDRPSNVERPKDGPHVRQAGAA